MSVPRIKTWARKKRAIATVICKKGTGVIKVNNVVLELVEPAILRVKVFEPILLLGKEKFSDVDILVTVKGGGNTAQIYAIRQAIGKAMVAYYQKYVDEKSKNEIKETLMKFDKSLLVMDTRFREPKKFGGRGARSKRQKSYR